MMCQTEIKAPRENNFISLEVLYTFSLLLFLYLPILCKTDQKPVPHQLEISLSGDFCSVPPNNVKNTKSN